MQVDSLDELSASAPPLNMSMGGSGGLITYGAVDTTNCDHHVNYVYLTSENVISDTGTSWIGAPSYIVNAVVNQTGAQLNYEYGFYTVLCSTMLTQPDLEFSINGVKYNVISEEYIIDLGLDYDTPFSDLMRRVSDLPGSLATHGSASTATSMTSVNSVSALLRPSIQNLEWDVLFVFMMAGD
ncbi:Inositol hexakisphosphate and diphosphoinositol-pentakisphosphate kinase [Parelaphostrongylus tenuis]|uniref:Inositol hexakisphosphate and diphosphoinositol-pentakisphosphate kinase n=1 Tax=Parelaphostrongylus tenuis TaxID=148309 RepID=A0AAD5RDC1_PARTN|nr:Inositol hexakisphosphate and diphosphoinositol-pentakisphosphate kinase [Parelaphostrongylus tenuis]